MSHCTCTHTHSTGLLQAASEGSGPTDAQSATRQASDNTPAAKQPSNQARLARALAATRLSKDLQEVLRHATLALLHASDADAVVGLQRYCRRTFFAVPNLRDGKQDDSQISSVIAQLTDGADTKVGGASLITQDALTAKILQQSKQMVPGDADQQFDWLEGVALQVSCLESGAATAHLLQCADVPCCLLGYTPNI